MTASPKSQREIDALYDWACELRSQGMSVVKIARTVGLGRNALTNWLKCGPPRLTKSADRSMNPAIVAEMRRMRKRGATVRAIADAVGVDYRTVHRRTRGLAPSPRRHERERMGQEVERLCRRFEESQTPANYEALREAVRRYEGLA